MVEPQQSKQYSVIKTNTVYESYRPEYEQNDRLAECQLICCYDQQFVRNRYLVIATAATAHVKNCCTFKEPKSIAFIT